jgi:hypothetical protein
MVSMIFDSTYRDWSSRTVQPSAPPITAEEIAEFRRLLEEARERDRREGRADCGTEEKRRKIKALADELSVEINFV